MKTLLKTEYQINALCRGSKIKINRYYRKHDTSHLWPISGRFNVTERAIRKVRQQQRYGDKIESLEYCIMLKIAISDIVNDILDF